MVVLPLMRGFVSPGCCSAAISWEVAMCYSWVLVYAEPCLCAGLALLMAQNAARLLITCLSLFNVYVFSIHYGSQLGLGRVSPVHCLDLYKCDNGFQTANNSCLWYLYNWQSTSEK